MAKVESTLHAAAAHFDDQLAAYARLGELFLKTPLTSVKHLERANQALAEIADCEQRLQDAGKQLIEALTSARQRQEQLASDVIAHAPRLQARNQQLDGLLAEMRQIASDVADLNGQVDQAASQQDPAAVSAGVLALSARAEALATSAREAELEEVATQAHALHQRLKAIGHKLQKATPN